jgi:hypothetical protein
MRPGAWRPRSGPDPLFAKRFVTDFARNPLDDAGALQNADDGANYIYNGDVAHALAGKKGDCMRKARVVGENVNSRGQRAVMAHKSTAGPRLVGLDPASSDVVESRLLRR